MNCAECNKPITIETAFTWTSPTEYVCFDCYKAARKPVPEEELAEYLVGRTITQALRRPPGVLEIALDNGAYILLVAGEDVVYYFEGKHELAKYLAERIQPKERNAT
jgi:hypothetical protein